MKLSVPVVYYSIIIILHVVMCVSVAKETEPASHIVKFTDDHTVTGKNLMIN